MKFIIVLIAAVFTNILAFVNSTESYFTTKTGDITIHIDNIVENKGTLYVGLFDTKQTFRKIDKVYKYKEISTGEKEATVTLENVPFDDYAVVIFQDFNENQEFDKSFIGWPKEPFGFSKNYRVSSKAPDFKEVKFDHENSNTELFIGLQIL